MQQKWLQHSKAQCGNSQERDGGKKGNVGFGTKGVDITKFCSAFPMVKVVKMLVK